ncbi:MAG: NAD(P)-dependent alcohol dehydrogenase [Spirosomataceae bacterium]
MKAIVCHEYGNPQVLHFEEVEKPTPNKTELLIRIKATAVNSADYRLRKADPFAVRFFFGLTKPKHKILGGVFSGTVEAIGSSVTQFKVGDHIFGSSALSYGFGTYAEYKTLPEHGVIALKPINLTHTEAATIPFGGTTALHFISKVKLQAGQRVFVNGASGAVGTMMVQLAKYYNAHVTAMCSATNQELVKSLGADVVLNYNITPFASLGESFDVIIDTVNKLPLSEATKKLTPQGKLVLVAAGLGEMLRGAWISATSKHQVITGVIREQAADVQFLRKLTEEGHLKPIIDRTYTLEQLSAAHEYVEKGHKRGNVAIIVD